jgi:hypothetical protein
MIKYGRISNKKYLTLLPVRSEHPSLRYRPMGGNMGRLVTAQIGGSPLDRYSYLNLNI